LGWAGVESEDKRYQHVVASAVMRAMFPADKGRRAFLHSLGAAAARPIEKKDLKVDFIPITCATPIIMAKPMGFYEKQGLPRTDPLQRRKHHEPVRSHRKASRHQAREGVDVEIHL
jgi:hypothetical protein